MHVRAMYRYPIKGAKGTEVESLAFDACGPIGDRRWMFVDESGRFLSQRSHPTLAQLNVTAQNSDASALLLSHPASDSEPIFVEARSGDQEIDVSVWKDSFRATVVPCANTWASELLSQPVRLVWLGNSSARPLSQSKLPGYVGFADAQPLLVIHEDDLSFIESRIRHPMVAARFRPNIVLAGGSCPSPAAWPDLEIDGLHLSGIKPCDRCRVVTLDPDSGVVDLPHLLQELMVTHEVSGKPTFGMTYQAVGTSTIRRGAQVLART